MLPIDIIVVLTVGVPLGVFGDAGDKTREVKTVDVLAGHHGFLAGGGLGLEGWGLEFGEGSGGGEGETDRERERE